MRDSPQLEEYINEQFPHRDECTYLNSATAGLVPADTMKAMSQFWQSAARGAPSKEDASREMIGVEHVRERTARLLGAAAEEVTFTSSTTHGLAIAATSLPLGSGDEVLIPEMEFPSVVYPFLNAAERRGFRVKLLNWEGYGPDLARIESQISGRTRALCLSWVQYQNGYTHDLARLGKLCRERDIFLIVDAIQGLGAIPLNLDGLQVDVVASGTFKWLMSGRGLGILYIRRALTEEMKPALAGYRGVTREVEDPDYHLELLDDVRRFDLGAPNEPGLIALGHSLGVLQQIGVDNVHERASRVAERVRRGAKERGYRINTRDEEVSPIVALSTGTRQTDNALLAHLQQNGISTCIRGMGLRIAPHFYCTEDDADKLLSLL